VKKVITIQSKQSIYALAVDLDENKIEVYSFYKLDFNAKTDEFKTKCLIENIEINIEKLQIDINYNVSFFVFPENEVNYYYYRENILHSYKVKEI
jgi:hypothetical protein